MEIKDDAYDKYRIVPNIKLGEFNFDTPIRNYLEGKTYSFHRDLEHSEEGFYSFHDPFIDVYVDSKGIITHISCEQFLIFENVNLIGNRYENFSFTPKLIEDVWINKNGEDIKQTVFDIDNLGLQIWVYKKLIVTVICSNLDEIPNAASSWLQIVKLFSS